MPYTVIFSHFNEKIVFSHFMYSKATMSSHIFEDKNVFSHCMPLNGDNDPHLNFEDDNFFSHCVTTYPSARGRRVTRGMRLPRKECTRSRHQRLFEENVGKTEKDVIYELLVKGSGVVFMHGEGISTPHVRHKRR